MSQWLDQIGRLAQRMGPTEWLFVLIGVALAGLLFLRGFGSRSGY
jgi:formate hydrogenlyase subunit 3/multisubunit Na+/H+ antiporter MnhD subunit